MYTGVVVVSGGGPSLQGLIGSEDFPPCLFPVANREVLAYQLEWFMRNGVRKMLVVAGERYRARLEAFLATAGGRPKDMDVSLVCVEVGEDGAELGTADALRHVGALGVADVGSDFIVLDSNTLISYPLCKLASKHRLSGAAITALFTHPPAKDDGEASKKKEEVDPRIKMPAICINAQGRVMLKPVQELAVGEGNVVEIFKRSIHNGGGFSMYADILDVGVYCCSASTLDFVQENAGVQTLGQGLLDAVVGSRGVESDFQYDAEIIGGQADGGEGQQGSGTGSGSVFNTRVTSSALLLHANRELPTYMLNAQQSGKRAVWTIASGYIKKAFSIVGTDVDVKEKVVMKLCAISDGCRVATKSKLNNSIIMQNVIIGENCTVQNSILATGCVLEENCNINDCLISANKTVGAGTKVKNEVL